MRHLKEYLACSNTQKISWHQFSKAQENSALPNHVYISNTIYVNTQKVVCALRTLEKKEEFLKV